MSHDDEEDKKLRETLKKEGVAVVSGKDMVSDKVKIVTLTIVDDKDHAAVGISVEWGDMKPPTNWDMDNLTETQMFTLVFMAHVEELLHRVKSHGTSAAASRVLREVTENNIDEIMAEIESLDDKNFH